MKRAAVLALFCLFLTASCAAESPRETPVVKVVREWAPSVTKIKPPKPLKAVRLADDIIIGETVVSIGNPFGLENSVSAGIVSGTNRVFSSAGRVVLEGLIQTDASINPGSSGGALFNLEGGLAGINLAVIQGAQSIGFAIPAAKVKNILKKYRELVSQKEASGS